MLKFVVLAVLAQTSPTPELIVFSGEYCQPCKLQAPIVRRLEQDGVRVYHVDVEKQPRVAEAWRVEAMPTLVVVRTSQYRGNLVASELRRFQGVQSYETLSALFRAAIPARSQPRAFNFAAFFFSAMAPQTVPFVAVAQAFAQETQGAPVQHLAVQKDSPPVDVSALAIACHVRVKVDRPNSTSWGSGVVITYGKIGTEILTNRHVVADGGTITIDDGTDYWSGVACREAWRSSTDDLAVIVASKSPPASAALCDAGYEPRTPLYLVGSPAAGPPAVCKITSFTRWNSPNGSTHLTLHGRHTLDGDSGGGVYDSAGVLVGVTWGDDSVDGGLAVDLTRTRMLSATTRKTSQAISQ